MLLAKKIIGNVEIQSNLTFQEFEMSIYFITKQLLGLDFFLLVLIGILIIEFNLGSCVNMYVKDVMVQNQVGLHARPATFFIQKANEFKSSIWIEKEERRVNAKSLLGILSLGIVGGTAIRIIADGSDEQAAVDALVELVESGFSEESR